jgi:hypothetical protein
MAYFNSIEDIKAARFIDFHPGSMNVNPNKVLMGESDDLSKYQMIAEL